MRILFASAEVTPFAKVGGLADVAGSLPKAVKKSGHDIRIIMPCYGSVSRDKYDLKPVNNSELDLNFGGKKISVSLLESKLPDSDVIVYFIVNNEYFGSHQEVYPKGNHSRFEQERFVVLSLASLELMKKIGFKPDIIHCNDWHTASMPVYVKNNYKNDLFYSKTSTLFTIHNLAYQGWYSPDILDFANLDRRKLFSPEFLELNNDVNWMKGGIIFSDRINTVSEEYAKEIQTPEYGEKLDNLLKENNHKLSGILNGVDYSVWNPVTDAILPVNYSIEDLSGKKVCKKDLQKELGLKQLVSKPLIGIVSRLADQKGLDLIAAIADKLKEMDLQLAILGTGDEKYEILFKDLTVTSENIRAAIGFNAILSEKMYAGCDMFLMPSKFEPCGLGQLIALKYGTIPIVRKTGGLADTIIDYNTDQKNGNGFVFEKYDSDQLLDAIERAIKVFKNKKNWNKIIETAMKNDHSWEKSADKYIDLYEKLRK